MDYFIHPSGLSSALLFIGMLFTLTSVIMDARNAVTGSKPGASIIVPNPLAIFGMMLLGLGATPLLWGPVSSML